MLRMRVSDGERIGCMIVDSLTILLTAALCRVEILAAIGINMRTITGREKNWGT
jgi:hypothetical protein